MQTPSLPSVFQDTDSFRIGLTLMKSLDASEKKWRIAGVASCEAVDQDGEQIIQRGIDCSPLLTSGFINWDHKDKEGPQYLIGEPLDAAVEYANGAGAALIVKGELYRDNAIAKGVWAHLNSTEARRRPLGWSVQGRVLARDPVNKSRITKSAVYHLAITHQPVNRSTFVELVKSLTGGTNRRGIPERFSEIYGSCRWMGSCYRQDGSFYAQAHGALDHLTLCRGYSAAQGLSLVAKLMQKGFC